MGHWRVNTSLHGLGSLAYSIGDSSWLKVTGQIVGGLVVGGPVVIGGKPQQAHHLAEIVPSIITTRKNH